MKHIPRQLTALLLILPIGAMLACAPRSAPVAKTAPPPPAKPVVAKQPTNPEEQTPSWQALKYRPTSPISEETVTRLSELSKEVAGKVFYELKEEGAEKLAGKIAVVAAVPLADLKKDTEFGRVMAEYLLTDLADRGLLVSELRLGKDITILPMTGEFIMSRNVGELAHEEPELDYVVLSTFSNTWKTLIMQGRLVDLKTGLVKSSWRYTLPLKHELLDMFQMARQPNTVAIKGMRKN